jgi:hypothetical protein
VTPVVAVKCYGFEWITELGLDEQSAARLMNSHGVDWALVQNILDPLPTSGVAQELPLDRYDERRFRDHLREQGIRTYESTAVFFQPQAVAEHPDLRPVAEDGTPMSMFDWYLGVSPHSPDYLAQRAELLEKVVTTLEPDGVFLSFIRFPGFWEAWTSSVRREDIRDHGFAAGSLARFEEETGNALPGGDTAAKARVVRHELRAEWTAWKCGVIVDAVRRLADAVQRARPGTEVLINGVAFPGLAEEVLGQDLGAISQVPAHIETMVYHQILGRPLAWIREVLEDLRPRVDGTLLASIQTSAAYTEPPHTGMGRAATLSPSEVAESLRVVASSPADGVSVYHWTDIAADELRSDGVMADALRHYKEGTL